MIYSKLEFLLIKIHMKTQKCLSPSKENMSPTKQGHKHGDPVTELLAYIKAAGLKLPSHI